MNKRIFIAGLLIFFSTTIGHAADLTGRWGGKVGDNLEISLNLKVDGQKLTGTVTTTYGEEPITDGKIKGDAFSFNVKANGGTIPYKGKIDGDKMLLTLTYGGKEMKGTLTRMKGDTQAQLPPPMKPQMTEYWEPVPKIVDPGPYLGMVVAPSDAIVLFDGKDLSQWKSKKDGGAANWKVDNGVFTVEKGTGDITTRQKFGDYQLHIEWRIPQDIQGQSQARGNSGVFLQDLSDELKIPAYWYEVQVLDSYNNATYVNGQAGSIYKQNPPKVNAMRKPGEWNVYDITYTAPRFKEDGSLFTPGRATVLHNGVVVQDNFEIRGHTAYIGFPKYHAPHGKAPITLQDHGDPSKAISFRNIWVREY